MNPDSTAMYSTYELTFFCIDRSHAFEGSEDGARTGHCAVGEDGAAGSLPCSSSE